MAWGPKPGRQMDREEELGWVEDPDLLDGVTGIALALLSAVSLVEPNWDRLLLTRIPIRSEARRRDADRATL
jgi:hypothetical protein